MMQPGMEDIYRRHSQGPTRTAREAYTSADTRRRRTNTGWNVAIATAASAVPAAPESVDLVNSPSPTT